MIWRQFQRKQQAVLKIGFGEGDYVQINKNKNKNPSYLNKRLFNAFDMKYETKM